MSEDQSRQEFLKANPHAKAWAALDKATNEQQRITSGPIRLKEGQFTGKKALILGSGVFGLTTAYELLARKTGMEVTILEANNRTGGRCLSLRTGDTLTEDADSQLFDSEPGTTQTVRFKRPKGDSEPYLNAGPGRIPSNHKRLLSYLKDFGVEVEHLSAGFDADFLEEEVSVVLKRSERFGSSTRVGERLHQQHSRPVAQWVAQNQSLDVGDRAGVPGLQSHRDALGLSG